jgi:uncharacterized RDD family membrane protein YckC
MSSPDKLTIETPEQTSLEFPLAGIGSRFLALAADTVLQIAAGLVLFIAVALVVSGLRPFRSISRQWTLALAILAVFLLQASYFAFFEAIWNGRTPGKRWARLRVIKDTGRPISVYDAVTRNLMRIVDSLPAFYGAGIVCALISRQNKRLGDYAAGTVVVHEKPLEGVRPTWESADKAVPAVQNVAMVTLEELQLVETFLERRLDLEPVTRRQYAAQISERLGQRLGIQHDDRLDAEKFLEALAQARRKIARYR